MGGSRPCNETCHWAASVTESEEGGLLSANSTWREKSRVVSVHPHCFHSLDRLFDAMGLQFGSFDFICGTAALVICPLVQGSSGQTATLTTHRLIRLSYLSLVSVRIPLRVLPTNSTSDVFRSDRGRSHDCHHDDLTHPGWTKGDPHVPLELYGH